MDFITPLLLLSGLAILNNKSSSSSNNISGEYGSVKNGKFVPKKQPSFKTELNEILIDLEEKLEIEDLRDFFMGVAWVESKFYPSAIKYETTGFIGVQNNPTRFKNNKWKSNSVYWNATMGLFQMFGSTALSVADGTAKNNSPLTLFNPYYSIAYGIDFASRLNKSYKANSWFDIRLGWHSLKLLADKTPEVMLEVENRIVKGINNSGGNPEILYKYNPNNFNKYRSEYGFKKLLNYILTTNQS
jgi:hypothetical protein